MYRNLSVFCVCAGASAAPFEGWATSDEESAVIANVRSKFERVSLCKIYEEVKETRTGGGSTFNMRADVDVGESVRHRRNISRVSRACSCHDVRGTLAQIGLSKVNMGYILDNCCNIHDCTPISHSIQTFNLTHPKE